MELYRKLWLDDVRPPPDDSWAWAKTVREAQLLFDVLPDVEECSLDHDLGATYADDADVETILLLAGHSPDGSGLDVARWMVENDRVPPKVRIHSWNAAGAMRMARVIADAGHAVTIRPFGRSVR